MLLDRNKSDKKRDTTGKMLQTPGDREFPMNPKIAALAEKIQILEAELEAELMLWTAPPPAHECRRCGRC